MCAESYTTHRNRLRSFNGDWCLGFNSENMMSLVLSASWESGVLKCPQGHLTYSQAWDLTAACCPFQPSQASFKGNLTLTYRFHLFSFFRIISNSYTMPQTLLSENKSQKSSLDPLSIATICSVYVRSESNRIQEQGALTGYLCFLINYSILNLLQTGFCSRIGHSVVQKHSHLLASKTPGFPVVSSLPPPARVSFSLISQCWEFLRSWYLAIFPFHSTSDAFRALGPWGW